MLYDVISASSYIVDIKLTVCLNAEGDCEYSETILSKTVLPNLTTGDTPSGNLISNNCIGIMFIRALGKRSIR